MKALRNSSAQYELVRYIVNGLIATGAHFGVLTFNIQVVGMRSAGVANLIAAIIGITTSFLGSRYFVFKKLQDPILSQATTFLALYVSIAALHGLILYGWTDVGGLDYRIGFLIATFFQVILSYFGNKTLVFRT
jgi:putative flippase GtrA